MTEQFTKEQFEAALPINKTNGRQLWLYKGFIDGEHVYSVPIDSVSVISIRSSINESGRAAGTGKDSIRCFLLDNQGNPLGSKVSKWVTRVPGWGERMKESIRILWKMRKAAGNNGDGSPRKIFKVKKEGVNKGRFFTKDDYGYFAWLS
jgi:hypothetical protein